MLKLAGTRSNRSALGAKVRLTAAGRTQIDEVRSGGSYLSQNDLRLHFGLGAAQRVDRIEIEWPSGARQTLRDVAADRVTCDRGAALASTVWRVPEAVAPPAPPGRPCRA